MRFERETRELRERTGASLTRIRAALEATNGQVGLAEEWIREDRIREIAGRTGHEPGECAAALDEESGDVEAAVASLERVSPRRRRALARKARHAADRAAGTVPLGRKLRTQATAGTIFLVVGLAFQVPFATSSLECSRTGGAAVSCRLRWTVFFDLIPVRSLEIPALVGVAMETSRSGSGTTERTSTVRLDTGDGTVRMNLLAEPGPASEAEEEIRAYLGDPSRPSLEVDLAPTGTMRWVRRMGAGIALFGLLYWIPIPLQLGRYLTFGEETTALP